MARIFGFDMGSTSIGWAVIDYDLQQRKGAILSNGLGCRIFPEARDVEGTPLNQNRRQKRMMRRQLRRRRLRRRALNECLTEAGLLPPFSSRSEKKDGGDAWHEMMREDPLALRKRGIDEPLEPYEVGRAIYHLAQRRHFRGRDLEDDDLPQDANAEPRTGKNGHEERSDDENEQSADEKAAEANRESTLAALKASGQTLGQFLFAKPADERRRGVHATNTPHCRRDHLIFRRQPRRYCDPAATQCG